MPCTQYGSERSLLIDALNAGAKGCLCASLFAVLACTSRAPGTRSSSPVPQIPSAPQRPSAPALMPPDLSCNPLATATFSGVQTVVATVAIEPVDIRRDGTAAHRFVFGHAYETLVRVDCTGRVIPGLAARWTTDRGLQTLHIRSGARFWDGDAVTAK